VAEALVCACTGKEVAGGVAPETVIEGGPEVGMKISLEVPSPVAE
jgi:hypothetical protein